MYYPGEMIADRYRVERELGEGGFGSVYEAVDVTIDRRVAVKVLKPDDGRGYKPATKARFEREARAVGKLQSPHTVTLLDYGDSDGKLFMIFELVPGEDLRAIINRRGRLEPHEAVHILRQLLDSLGEAHRHGILHRDIKPANIRVFPWADNPMFVKLLDFGLARPTDDGSPGVTVTGEMIGTPRYMSPEQLSTAPLTPASDIYSLGMVFLEMLVGSAPLQGNRWSDQFERMMTGHVFSFPELQRIGPHLMGIINKMTARDVAARYRSIEPISTALRPATLAGTPVEADMPVRRRSGAILAVFVALLAALGGVLWVNANKAEPERVVHEPARPVGLVKGASSAPDVAPVKVTDQGRESTADAANPHSCGEPGWGYFTSDDGWIGAHYIPTHTLQSPRPVVIVLPRNHANRHRVFVLGDVEHLVDTRRRFVEETRLTQLADEKGFYLVIPPGKMNWNESGDVGRTEEHLDWLSAADGCVDTNRVYVIGDHFGGALAYMLSESPRVAAVAIFSFLLSGYNPIPDPYWNPTARDVPLLHIVPKNSNYVMLPKDASSPCCLPGFGYEHWLSAWGKRNGCSPKTRIEDGCRVFQKCDSALVSCEVEGGYHWPGTTRDRDKNECGVEEYAQVDFENTVWRFFQDKRVEE